MGVFSKNNQPETNIKRNAYDGSFQNNLTLKMGYLYPCLCKEVIPGDTFRINAAFGLRFMPTAFPIQTKIKTHIDFFYVRNRNLWKDFINYYTQVGPHDGFPILSSDQKLKQFSTGSLGDYLGLPSTVIGKNSTTLIMQPLISMFEHGTSQAYLNYRIKFSNSTIFTNSLEDVKFFTYVTPSYVEYEHLGINVETFNPSQLRTQGKITTINGKEYLVFDTQGLTGFFDTYLPKINETIKQLRPCISLPFGVSDSQVNVKMYPDFTSDLKTCFYENGKLYLLKFWGNSTFPDENQEYVLHFYSSDGSALTLTPTKTWFGNLYSDSKIPFIDNKLDNNYVVSEATQAPKVDISALPFRAYEQIYNAFYRDNRNNPLVVDGVVDPNRFLPRLQGGSDPTEYVLRKRNWEQDFLTTALPSPQFGSAPLVGITSSGVATFSDEEGNLITSKLSVDNDGDTVVGFASTKDSSVNNTLIKLASSGISINDLRGVNSLQRYLETKYRKGLRYKDQIEAHYGVNISQEILDMPEFIGSISQMVDVSQINQTSETSTDPLGSYAGQLSCVGGRKDGFQKYCDEPGFIIGIISVVPVPVYSQLLPKHFLKTHEPLDFYFPEFAHLGYQPIKYNEVCPLQATLKGVSLDRTFGYQRAWYDYLSYTDEIHGDFRTTLNNFVLARTFNDLPSLNEHFLTIDPEQMNDIFTVNEVNGKPIDTILGQIHFDITMMRPIPRFGVPRLE